MAQNDVAAVASGEAPGPATPPTKGAESNVFDLAPSTEAAVPDTDQAKADGPPPALMNAIPAFMHTMVHQSFAEDLLPDWETLGPDAFPNRRTWVARGLTLPGQPSKDIRVIDILGDGTRVDRGEAAFEQANPLLQTAFPEGSGVCRVIVGVPELGKVDRDFAMRAVNLPGERILGSAPDGVFEQSHFRSRVCPAFDLARLRDLWTMEEVAWRPFWLPIASMRTPTEKPGPAPTPTEGAVRASGRDVLYFHLSFAVVQTIPLQGDKFLCKSRLILFPRAFRVRLTEDAVVVLCTLPSRSFSNDSPLRSAPDFAGLKEMTKEGPGLSKEQIFEILSRDQKRTARQRFETLLLSEKSATKLANADSTKLCQLLLLDFFRAISDTSAALATDISASMGALDIAVLNADDPETVLSELQSGRMIVDSLVPNIGLYKQGAEHLLQCLALESSDSHDSGNNNDNNNKNKKTVTKHKRWLDHTTFALRNDLEHVLFSMQSFQDFWTRQSTEQGEHVKRIEAKNVARLALLAAIFLPLSFGADLLGMQFRLSELGYILYDYLGLVVCCGLFIFIVYKVAPFFAVVIMMLWPRTATQRNTATLLARGFLQTHWLTMLVVLWSILVASFLIGMTGDIPYSLVVLKWGCIAWGVLFALYLLTAVVFGWLLSILYKVLGWNVVG